MNQITFRRSKVVKICTLTMAWYNDYWIQWTSNSNNIYVYTQIWVVVFDVLMPLMHKKSVLHHKYINNLGWNSPSSLLIDKTEIIITVSSSKTFSLVSHLGGNRKQEWAKVLIVPHFCSSSLSLIFLCVWSETESEVGYLSALLHRGGNWNAEIRG